MARIELTSSWQQIVDGPALIVAEVIDGPVQYVDSSIEPTTNSAIEDFTLGPDDNIEVTFGCWMRCPLSGVTAVIELVSIVSENPALGFPVPVGGTTGQVLTKASDTSGDTHWTTPVAAAAQVTFAPAAGVGATNVQAAIEEVAGDVTAQALATTAALALKLDVTAAREKLTANRTYYVRTDGSDSNTGLVNDASGAFLTLQKPATIIRDILDLNGFNVTVEVGAGTYTAGVVLGSPSVGEGVVSFIGDTTTPSNVLLDLAGAGIAFNISRGAAVWIGGFKVQASGAAQLIRAWEGGRIYVNGAMEYGAAPGGRHIIAFRNAYIEVTANYTISGGCGYHVSASQNSVIILNGRTVTLTGTPAFTAFALFQLCASTSISGNTYVGSATGPRHDVNTNGAVNTGGGGANYFPGNAPGSVTTGGSFT